MSALTPALLRLSRGATALVPRVCSLPSRPLAPRRAWWTCALVALALAGCGGEPPQHDVLIVSFDTLRADRLGVYGNSDWGVTTSPQVDRLAARGVTFDHVVATRGQTHPSLGAMLSGKYPITTGLRENGYLLLPQHATIMQLLKRAGFQTGIFVSNFDRSDPMDSWVFRGADVAGDGAHGQLMQQAGHAESRFQSVWDDNVEHAALDFLDALDADRPFAAWVHFYDVHKPYNPPAGQLSLYGMSPGVPAVLRAPGPDSGMALEQHLREITLGDREVGAAELRRILGLYDGGVTATDERLGHLLDKLEAVGRSDSTYFVFTSDHGEELFDHNRYFFHGNSVYQSVLQLPLVIAGPGLPAGTRVAAPNVQNIDVAPTLLELLGLPPAPDMEGRSLAALLRGETTEPPRAHAFSEWQDIVYRVTDGTYSYIHNPMHAHLLKEPYQSRPGETVTRGYPLRCFEAYDLRTDPREQHDLLAALDPATMGSADGLPAGIAPLREALDRWLADPRHEREMSWPGLDDEAAARLRREKMAQLGYIEGGQLSRDVLIKEPCASPR
jgi:arylsulfatase A-like enzyme